MGANFSSTGSGEVALALALAQKGPVPKCLPCALPDGSTHLHSPTRTSCDTADTGRIPNLIHQMEFLPPKSRTELLGLTAHTKRLHADWCVHYWTDEEMGRLAFSLPVVRGAYAALTTGVMRSDMARVAILYVYGGWYVDTDVLCARKLSELAAPGEQELVLIEQPRTRKEKRLGGRRRHLEKFSWKRISSLRKSAPPSEVEVANFLMGSAPHHPLWNATLANVAGRVRTLDSRIRADASHELVLSTTGSSAITEAWLELSRRASAQPPRATQLVEQVPSWLLHQAGLSEAGRGGQRTHAGGHIGGGRTAAVMPPFALQGGAVCYHLNLFSWKNAWKSFAAGRQRVQSSRLMGGSRQARVARGPKASGAFDGPGLGRWRRQRGAERRDEPVSALARIPPAKAGITANQPAGAETLAAIRKQAKWQRVFVHNSSADELRRALQMQNMMQLASINGRALQEEGGGKEGGSAAEIADGKRLPTLRATARRRLAAVLRGSKRAKRSQLAGGAARSATAATDAATDAACTKLSLLGVRSILFVGDSFTRQLYLATLLLLMPQAARLSPTVLAPVTPWAPSASAAPRCTAEQVATATGDTVECRHAFARSTKQMDVVRQSALCAGRVSLEFVYGGIKETAATGAGSAEYPGIEVAAPADMVVLGYGIWDDFSDKAVQLRVRRHLAAVQQWGGSAPRLIFLASDARHRSEFIWQSDKHVVIFNGKMAAYWRGHTYRDARGGRPLFVSFYALTKRKQPFDGTHYSSAVNRIKASRLITSLDARASSAQKEELLSTSTDAVAATTLAGKLRPKNVRAGGHRNRGHRGVPPRLRTVHQANGSRAAERAVRWPRLSSVPPKRHVTALLANSTSRSNCYIVSLLGTRASDLMDAQRMARTLQYFGDGGRHPLILFHEASAPRAGLDAIRLALSSHRRQLRPALVDFPRGPPAGLGLQSPTAGPKTTHNRKGWGYYHMINFFAFDMFRHPALGDAEYVMRIDCDGALHAPMPDLFALAKLRGAAYVTPVGNADCGAIVEGLPGLAYAAAERHGLEARVLPLMFRNRCKGCPSKGRCKLCPSNGKLCVIGFYNNLEVVRVADFVAPPPAAANFASAVQRSLGIYRHRWGDAIIRRLMLALMGSKVLFLDELAPRSKYCHRDYCMPGNTHTNKFGKVSRFQLAAFF